MVQLPRLRCPSHVRCSGLRYHGGVAASRTSTCSLSLFLRRARRTPFSRSLYGGETHLAPAHTQGSDLSGHLPAADQIAVLVIDDLALHGSVGRAARPTCQRRAQYSRNHDAMAGCPQSMERGVHKATCRRNSQARAHGLLQTIQKNSTPLQAWCNRPGLGARVMFAALGFGTMEGSRPPGHPPAP